MWLNSINCSQNTFAAAGWEFDNLLALCDKSKQENVYLLISYIVIDIHKPSAHFGNLFLFSNDLFIPKELCIHLKFRLRIYIMWFSIYMNY